MLIRKKHIRTDTLIAFTAAIASLCAVVVTIYQAKLSREQQLNSVWPYLLVYETLPESGQPALVIANYGIGPAIIDSVRILYKGRWYASPTEVISFVSQQRKLGPYGMPWSHTHISKGYAIPQGQTIEWFSLNKPEDKAIFMEVLQQMKAVVYYHSIYEEHWHSTFNRSEDEEMVVKD